MALKANTTTIPTTDDNVIVINNGKSIELDEVRVINNGVTSTVWLKQKYYYISFNANGGSGSMSTQSVPIDVLTKITSNTFTRNGYSFIGWSTSSSGNVGYTDGQSVTNLASAGNTITLYAVWLAEAKILFSRLSTNNYCDYRWYRATTPNNGWGAATCYTDYNNTIVGSWNRIDCTDYNYCTVRISGHVDSDPSGTTVNGTDIRIGFNSDYDKCTTVVTKWNDTSGGEGQNGAAYDRWYDLTIDISAFTGVQTLNVFIGGAYMNGGVLHCSMIMMHNFKECEYKQLPNVFVNGVFAENITSITNLNLSNNTLNGSVEIDADDSDAETCSVNGIIMTDYSTMEVVVKCTRYESYSGHAYIYCGIDSWSRSIDGDTTVSFDISSYTGAHNLTFRLEVNDDASAYITISKIILK